MNRKQTIIIALFTFISIRVIAQQRLTVRDSLTQEPIAYMSVWFGNEVEGYTDESGMIEIPKGTKKIRLSHICYETKSIVKVTADAQTIFLVPKITNIDEVAVSAKAPKRIKATEVGLMKAKTQTKHKGANGFEMALFIPYDSAWAETPYIHSILASLDYSTHWRYSRKSRHLSMPLSALTFGCQMPRLVLPKTSPSLAAVSYSLPVRNSARMASVLLVLYHSPRLVYSLWWNG